MTEEVYCGQPSLINIPLFIHQLKSIEDMENLEKEKEVTITWSSQFNLKMSNYLRTSIGSFSDFPGHGKSLSMLGLIAKTLCDPCSDGFLLQKIEAFKYVTNIKVEIIHQSKCSLILVNISLISQWIFELNRTLLRYKAIYNRSDIENIEIDEYDVIVVTNNVYNSFAALYKRKSWKRFVIDEPSSLKIPNMEPSNALFFWLITATPFELYLKRRTGFLNDLLPDDVNIFKYLIVKNDDEFVKHSYEMPHTRHLRYKCSGNISKIFEGLVSDNIMEMIDAGNIEGVFIAFGIKRNSNLFESFKMKKMKRLEALKNEKQTKKIIEKIQFVESHIKVFDQRMIKYISENSCCLKTTNSIFSCCQKLGCSSCFGPICPLCKNSDVCLVNLNYNIPSSDMIRENVKENKINTILDIIGDSLGKKILVFSNHNESFTILKRFLDEKSLKYLELRGTKEKRDTTIDQYKTGNINILLLNMISSGAGLNLHETTDIIMYHALPEFQRIQVIGRANRIGRVIELNVHYME
jgi:SNF2 family DNA or RNA helicase